MLPFSKKNRLENLSLQYKSLIDQAKDFKKRGEFRLSFMRLEEADLVNAVMHRIKRTV